VLLGVLAASVAGVPEEDGRRTSAERAIVADIGPQTAGDGLALGQHRHGRVVAVQPFGGEYVLVDQLMEWGKSGGPGTDMIRQTGDVEIDAFPGIALALPVQRLMTAVLLEQDHRQQAGADPGTRDDVERCRRLGERLAVPAGELLSHGLPYEPAPRDDVEGLGDDLAHLGEPMAPAAAAGGGWRDDNALARQMHRQGSAHRLLPDMGCDDRAGGGFHGRLVLGRGFLELGQLKLELVDEPLASLAGLAELLAPGLGEQQLQPLNLQRGYRDQRLGLAPGTALGQDHRVRRGEVAWQGCRLVGHGGMQAHPALFLKSKDERRRDSCSN
jgi:hypothetical protein